jgi:hypothetical protein
MIAGAHPQRGDGSGREERDHPWHGSGGPLGELDLLTSEPSSRMGSPEPGEVLVVPARGVREIVTEDPCFATQSALVI